MPQGDKGQRWDHLPLNISGAQECALRGSALLNTPYFNKGTAHPHAERDEFGLNGHLPEGAQSLEQQVKRAYQQYSSRPGDLAKNTFMTSLREQNDVLFYRLIQDHLKEVMPVIYTPTEGEAIANYSRLFRRPEGCFLSINNESRVLQDLSQFGMPEDIDYIVVSDGEEILGIGDQGVGAILISVAKLVLATACAGVHPNRCLPVVLDVGTDNDELLNDDLYLGLRQKRVRGEEYDKFVDTFVRSARKLYPKAYIHFEDFGLQSARKILEKYRPEFACFNDDVQGTGCVTLAGIMAALKIANVKIEDAKVVVFGAGTAGTGIADMITDAIATASSKSKEEAAKQIWCIDKPGLLLKSHGDKLTMAQRPYARTEDSWKEGTDLHAVIKTVHPHVLIGTSTKPNTFTQPIVEEMASHVERPIIFPLSNPTRLHEAKPKDLIEWTKGKALVATGSPFPAVEYGGKTIQIAECNNSTIFPGIGLGTILCRAKLLSDAMLVASVNALSNFSPALSKSKSPIGENVIGALLPDVEDVRELSVSVAAAVIKKAVEEELATVDGIPTDDKELDEWIRVQMWEPKYRTLKRVDQKNASREARGEMGRRKSLVRPSLHPDFIFKRRIIQLTH